MSNIRLVDRDYLIFNEIERWRVITGKHICNMTGFSGQRACDRRLRKLLTAGFIARNKYLYGIPALYELTSKGKIIIGLPNKKERVRIEQIAHDICVLDTAIYFNRKYNIAFADILTEKQLHMRDGFGVRKHRPDFVFTRNSKTYCVEIELSLKSKDRFKKNIIDNFNNYYKQIWIVPDLHCAIHSFLKEMNETYPNINIIDIAEVKKIWT